LKNYFVQYKPFLLFLGTFFLAYLILSFLYNFYLNSFELNQVDGFTDLVSRHAQKILSLFDVAAVEHNLDEKSIKLIYKSRYVARIIEGCNSASVMILFTAFVIAFSGKWKPTLFYIIVGSSVLYFLNVLRIVFLAVLIYHFPERQSFLHGVLFPLLIYGSVFVLWVIWINKFSGYASKNAK
jgi:exosortase family protein XrtF